LVVGLFVAVLALLLLPVLLPSLFLLAMSAVA
jgi:hypothetical protein